MYFHRHSHSHSHSIRLVSTLYYLVLYISYDVAIFPSPILWRSSSLRLRFCTGSSSQPIRLFSSLKLFGKWEIGSIDRLSRIHSCLYNLSVSCGSRAIKSAINSPQMSGKWRRVDCIFLCIYFVTLAALLIACRGLVYALGHIIAYNMHSCSYLAPWPKRDRHTKRQRIAHLSGRKSTNNSAMPSRKLARDPTSSSSDHVAHTRAVAPVMLHIILHAPPTARCHNLHTRPGNATALQIYTARNGWGYLTLHYWWLKNIIIILQNYKI